MGASEKHDYGSTTITLSSLSAARVQKAAPTWRDFKKRAPSGPCTPETLDPKPYAKKPPAGTSTMTAGLWSASY